MVRILMILEAVRRLGCTHFGFVSSFTGRQPDRAACCDPLSASPVLNCPFHNRLD